jgi:transcriptional regulator with XRE-family HTH domain
MRDQQETDSLNTSFLASNLRLLRKKFQWSQEEFASRVGLNRGNIASYENGSTEPRVQSLLKMSELFQVSIKELVFEDLSKGLQRESTTLPATLPDIENFLFRAKELEAVFKGLHTCCMFKTKQWGEEVPRDVHILVMHFEELYQAAQTMLKEHQNLISKVHNCPHNGE